MKLENLGIF